MTTGMEDSGGWWPTEKSSPDPPPAASGAPAPGPEPDRWATDSWLTDPDGWATDTPSTVASGFADALAADVSLADPADLAAAARQGEAARDVAANQTGGPMVPSRPVRLALGLAILAAERIRSTGRAASERPRNDAPSGAFVTGVGLLQQSAADAREAARRAMDRPAQLASRTATWASGLPGSDLVRAAGENSRALNGPRDAFARSRATIDRLVADARGRGEAAVSESRSDASAFVQAAVSDAIGWAQAQVIPQIVDGLVPHLVESVVPRIIDGALPDIRARVLPVIIEDLTNDPQIRDLALQQGRGVVDDAAEHIRSTTATADDRVESAFRRLVHGGANDAARRAQESTPPSGTG